MSYEEFYSIFDESGRGPFPEFRFSRKQLIDFADKKDSFDVIVAGGGIHAARLAV